MYPPFSVSGSAPVGNMPVWKSRCMRSFSLREKRTSKGWKTSPPQNKVFRWIRSPYCLSPTHRPKFGSSASVPAEGADTTVRVLQLPQPALSYPLDEKPLGCEARSSDETTREDPVSWNTTCVMTRYMYPNRLRLLRVQPLLTVP